MIGVVVWVAALVWVAAVAGFHFPGDVFLGEEIRRGGDGRLGPAVHLGDHEGLDAALLVTSALVLTRYRPRLAVGFVLGLAFVYGLVVEWRDFWFEQVVKRDWTCVDAPAGTDAALERGLGGTASAGRGRRARRQAARRASATRRRSSTNDASSRSRSSERRIDDGCTVAMTTGASSDSTGTPRSRLTRNWRPSSA